MLVKIAFAFLLAILGLSTTAHAWWCTGHMIVAEIARQNLNSGIEDKLKPYIQFMNTLGPFTQSPDMVQAACWADDLKAQGVTPMKGWHFIDQPYDPSNFPLPKSSELMKDNIAAEISSLQETGKDYKARSKKWIIAFTLMNLLHFYGDIHQPLHTATLFSSQFPKSDYGGNLFHVTINGKSWILHQVWDSVCTQYMTELARPLSAGNASFIQTQAQNIMAANNIPEEQKREWNSTVMAQEGLQYAEKDAYAGLQPNGPIPSGYLAQCKKVASLRIAQAGYRLASELNYIFEHFNGDEDLSNLHVRLNYHRDAFLKGRGVMRRN